MRDANETAGERKARVMAMVARRVYRHAKAKRVAAGKPVLQRIALVVHPDDGPVAQSFALSYSSPRFNVKSGGFVSSNYAARDFDANGRAD